MSKFDLSVVFLALLINGALIAISHIDLWITIGSVVSMQLLVMFMIAIIMRSSAITIALACFLAMLAYLINLGMLIAILHFGGKYVLIQHGNMLYVIFGLIAIGYFYRTLKESLENLSGLSTFTAESQMRQDRPLILKNAGKVVLVEIDAMDDPQLEQLRQKYHITRRDIRWSTEKSSAKHTFEFTIADTLDEAIELIEFYRKGLSFYLAARDRFLKGEAQTSNPDYPLPGTLDEMNLAVWKFMAGKKAHEQNILLKFVPNKKHTKRTQTQEEIDPPDDDTLHKIAVGLPNMRGAGSFYDRHHFDE